MHDDVVSDVVTFLAPERLMLLVGVGVVVAVYLVAQRRRAQAAARFANPRMLASVAPVRPGWRRHAPAAGFLVALSALVFGFAQPATSQRVPRKKAVVIVAIDTSLSMSATDVAPSRLAAEQSAAKQFIDQLPRTIEVGLVGFHGTAQLFVSPTTDRTVVRAAIDRLQLGEATAVGEAIFTALDAVSKQLDETDGGVIPARIVLMSDGVTNMGRADGEGAAAARAVGVRVDTIAYGTNRGTIRVPGEADPVPVPVNQDALRAIAQQTRATFHVATSAGELNGAYRNIGSIIAFDTKLCEVSAWFVGIALLALLVTGTMSLVWFGRLP